VIGALQETTRARLEELVRDFPDRPAALIAALYVVQEEENHLTEENLSGLAAFLGMPKSQVYQTATFYSLFEFGPQGRHIIRICRSICCFLRGGDAIYDHLRRRLGIGPEETTPDGRFTLKLSECLALCNRAPSMMIDEKCFGPLTPDEVDRILETYHD
jgi:NADH-quinone oxidoreductase subunit E